MPKLALALVIAAMPLAATAQDCDNAVDQQTMNLCAHATWEAADAELNRAYQQAMDFMESIDADLPMDEQGAAKALRDAQRAWINFRDLACQAEGYLMQGGSAQPMIISGCMTTLTQQRTTSLAELAGQY
jgi:uncharacterized protein YecT (DUF1311 family)